MSFLGYLCEWNLDCSVLEQRTFIIYALKCKKIGNYNFLYLSCSTLNIIIQLVLLSLVVDRNLNFFKERACAEK